MSVFIKDPAATLDYVLTWTTYLAASEAVTSSTWAASSTNVQIGTSSGLTMTNTTNSATVWVRGGTAGEVYRLTNQIRTNQNRVDERHVVVRVENR
jgi:hypothetical protein